MQGVDVNKIKYSIFVFFIFFVGIILGIDIYQEDWKFLLKHSLLLFLGYGMGLLAEKAKILFWYKNREDEE